MPDEDRRTPTERVRDAIAEQFRAQRANYASPYARKLHDAITSSGTTPAESGTTVRPSLVEAGHDPRETRRRRDAAAGADDPIRAIVRARRGLPPLDGDDEDDEQRPETDAGRQAEQMADDLRDNWADWARNGGNPDDEDQADTTGGAA